MKKPLYGNTIIIAMATLILISCKSTDTANTGGPKETVEKFFGHIAKKDFEGAAAFATKKSKSSLDMIEGAIKMAENMKMAIPEDQDYSKQMADAQFGEPRIAGDSAFIPVSSKSNKQAPAEIPLIKENGQWKVDFSMQAMMKMGNQQLQKNGDLPDSALNSETMQKVMKSADSMLKNMDPKKLEELKKSAEELKKQLGQ